MIFDGLKFRRTKKVVTIAPSLWKDPHYIEFGRIAKDFTDPKAVETNWYYDSPGGKIPIKAIPIKASGHSHTNMMYGKDGYTYLFLKGMVYIRKTK